MLVRQAKAAARDWVMAEGQRTPGFVAAHVAGSANDMADGAPYPATSDLDVRLVLEDAAAAPAPGKFVHLGALLEVSHIDRAALASVEDLLGDPVLAGDFRVDSTILDPTGLVASLHEVVSREFPRRRWVWARCERAADMARRAARALDVTMPLHDQAAVTAFAAGLTTFVVLAAGLRNGTVRKRYAAAREVLVEHGMPGVHEEMLGLLGCAGMGRERVERHLAWVTAAFDAAAPVRRTPYRFWSDISPAARSIAIDGSRELIEAGLHREAVFWLVATSSRCRHIVAADAPEMLPRLDEQMLSLLTDLGIESYEARLRRCAEVETFLPRVLAVAEEVVARNEGVVA